MTNREKVLQAFSVDTKSRPSILQIIADGHFRARDVLEALEAGDISINSEVFLRRLRRLATREGKVTHQDTIDKT